MPRVTSISTSRSRPWMSSYKPNASVSIPQSIKVEQPGLFSNMWSGFGLGTGQAIAHNLFRSAPATPAAPAPASTPLVDHKEFEQCMKESENDMEACRKFLK